MELNKNEVIEYFEKLIDGNAVTNNDTERKMILGALAFARKFKILNNKEYHRLLER